MDSFTSISIGWPKSGSPMQATTDLEPHDKSKMALPLRDSTRVGLDTKGASMSKPRRSFLLLPQENRSPVAVHATMWLWPHEAPTIL